MSKTHRKEEFGGFDYRICSAVSGFGYVPSLTTKPDVLKTGNRGAGKRFGGFCRIIRNGTTGKIIEIKQHSIIDGVDSDTIGLPEKFQIDFDAKIIRPSKESLVRKTISFESVEHIENKIIIQGFDEGVEGIDDSLAWRLTISKKDGKSILSASGDGVAYVVFGVCTPVT